MRCRVSMTALVCVLAVTAGAAAEPVLDREVGPYERAANERAAAAWPTILIDAFGLPTHIGILRPASCAAAGAAAGRCVQQERGSDDSGGAAASHRDSDDCEQC